MAQTAEKSIRKAVRSYRQEHGLTLKQAGEALGVATATVDRLEKLGSCNVRVLERLKHGTGLSYDELLGAQ